MKTKIKSEDLDELQFRAMTPWEKKALKKRITREQINICLTINFEENGTRNSITKKGRK